MTTTTSPFHGYVQRLMQSTNPVERDSLYFGHTKYHHNPVLVPVEMLFEHMHILGAPGTGKSALGIAPLITQLIQRNDGPVIVLDLKGDMALFNTAKIEAENVGSQFKWFTNKPNRSTYVFNPWQQGYLEQLTIQEVLGLFQLSLNMHHGDDYGRAFFSLLARNLLRDALDQALNLQRGPVQRRSRRTSGLPKSFEELVAILESSAANREEQRAGEHLLFVLKSLIDFPQLNFSQRDVHSSLVIQNAIHMPDVIRERQVIYFFLQPLMDVTTVSEIARLAMYSALCAAAAYRTETGEKPRVYLIADEAQHLIAQNIANVLAQAREFQLGCVLAHQSMSQLNPPGGVDLRHLVTSCTSVKQFWSVRDLLQMDDVSKMSGEVAHFSASWDQIAGGETEFKVSRILAAARPEEPAYIRINETVGPRMTHQDVEDFSREPNTNIMTIERHAGLSCFNGAFPVHMDWIMSAEEHRHRNLEIPWPKQTHETIVAPCIATQIQQHEHLVDASENPIQLDDSEPAKAPSSSVSVFDRLKQAARKHKRN